jgi:hypothetical protein
LLGFLLRSGSSQKHARQLAFGYKPGFYSFRTQKTEVRTTTAAGKEGQEPPRKTGMERVSEICG